MDYKDLINILGTPSGSCVVTSGDRQIMYFYKLKQAQAAIKILDPRVRRLCFFVEYPTGHRVAEQQQYPGQYLPPKYEPIFILCFAAPPQGAVPIRGHLYRVPAPLALGAMSEVLNWVKAGA